MIQHVECWQTTDGINFDDYDDAVDHEICYWQKKGKIRLLDYDMNETVYGHEVSFIYIGNTDKELYTEALDNLISLCSIEDLMEQTDRIRYYLKPNMVLMYNCDTQKWECDKQLEDRFEEMQTMRNKIAAIKSGVK